MNDMEFSTVIAAAAAASFILLGLSTATLQTIVCGSLADLDMTGWPRSDRGGRRDP